MDRELDRRRPIAYSIFQLADVALHRGDRRRPAGSTRRRSTSDRARRAGHRGGEPQPRIGDDRLLDGNAAERRDARPRCRRVRGAEVAGQRGGGASRSPGAAGEGTAPRPGLKSIARRRWSPVRSRCCSGSRWRLPATRGGEGGAPARPGAHRQGLPALRALSSALLPQDAPLSRCPPASCAGGRTSAPRRTPRTCIPSAACSGSRRR